MRAVPSVRFDARTAFLLRTQASPEAGRRRIDDYSTVEPDDKAVMPIQYKRDGMRNMGHMNGMIPQADAPPDGNVAAPGWYLLFVVNATRIPSVGRWIQLGV